MRCERFLLIAVAQCKRAFFCCFFRFFFNMQIFCDSSPARYQSIRHDIFRIALFPPWVSPLPPPGPTFPQPVTMFAEDSVRLPPPGPTSPEQQRCLPKTPTTPTHSTPTLAITSRSFPSALPARFGSSQNAKGQIPWEASPPSR